MIKVEHIAFLLYKELEGNLSEAEAIELQRWGAENPEHEKFLEEIMDEDKFADMLKMHHPENKKAIRESILKKIEGQLEFKVVPLYRRSFFRIAVAACIALLVIAGGYFIFFDKRSTKTDIAKMEDIKAPTSDKAVITLADGKVIAVDSLTSYSQGSVQVTRTKDGKIIYTGFGSEVTFNTLTNPRGSKVIDITLADGSHVWLNAGSSITYPVSFAGNERKVSMTGEGYFNVAHNAAKPFTVSKGNMNVTVLGTEFNVNAYDDEEDIKVTLLKGSVKVQHGNESSLLQPGQQAQVSPNGGDLEGAIKIVSNINTDETVAWLNGLFSFNRADIKTIMRQLARWYDVEVSYEGQIPQREFSGEMQRDLSLSGMIRLLEKGKIHVKLEGRKLVIGP